MKLLFKLSVLAATISMASYGVCAEKPAPAKAPAPTPTKSESAAAARNTPATPPANASTAAANVEQLKNQFKAQSDAVMAEHARLKEALKKATESEKEKILAEMQKTLDQQRAQGKQIREDMRKLRQAAPASPGGRR